MRRTRHRILIATGAALFLFGVGVTPAWLAFQSFGGRSQSATEFPLGHLVDAAADSKGQLYVADGIYRRIQQYSPDGHFQRGWSVPGIVGVRVTADDQLEVATRSASTVQVFRPDGTMAVEFRADNIWSYSPTYKDAGPRLARSGLLPRIVDRETGRTVVSTPLAKRLLAAPLPAMAYAAIGIALLAVGERLRRRHPTR